MNIAIKLTMDGLVRGLRGFAHDLADELERSYAAQLRRDDSGSSTVPAKAGPGKGLVDERRG